MKRTLLILLCLPLITLAQQTYIPDTNLEGDIENVARNCNNLSYSSPFIGLVLEEVDNTLGAFTNGEKTYRLYAELSSGLVNQMFGDSARPHLISTTTTFYQDGFGENIQAAINPAFFGMAPSLEFDSWVTIGDSYTSGPSEIGGALLNWSSFAGFSWSFGGTPSSDASIFRVSTDPLCLPDANGRVLLGQFTTTGVLSGYINLKGLDNGIPWEENNIPIPQFQTSIAGCTDSLASNYNSLATVNDSSCTYPLIDTVFISQNSICNGDILSNSMQIDIAQTIPSTTYKILIGFYASNTNYFISYNSTSPTTITSINILGFNHNTDYFIRLIDSSAYYNANGGTINGVSTTGVFDEWPYPMNFINPPLITTNQTIPMCNGDSVIVGSNVYNTAGNYTDTLNTSNGCDSVVHTYLMIDENTSSYDTLSVAASIVWNGMNLTVSGDYSYTLTNSVGCDSIVNLNLTVTTTGISDIVNNKSNLIKITDMLGQETPFRRNTPLFYIYDDGTVEKRIVAD